MAIAEKIREARWKFDINTTTRIEALSDGVFAIVLTLLVFQIRTPDLSPENAATQLWPRLLHQWPEFYSYMISFMIVGAYWIGHHGLYHMVKRSSLTLLWLNLVFLMFVAFLPFSVGLFGRYGDQQRIQILYGVHLMIIGGLNYVQWKYVTRWNRLVEDGVDDKLERDIDNRIMMTPAICLLAILISFFDLRWSKMIYLLLLGFYLLPLRLNRFFTRSK